MLRIAAFLVAVFGALLSSTIVAARETPTVALRNVDVLDQSFDSITPAQTILIESGRIITVGDVTTVVIPENAEVFDLPGKIVIPGLWDAHVHTRYEGIDHLNLLLLHGVTTLRDLGGPWPHVERLTEWRERIASGEMLGPTIWTGGTVLNNPGANWSHITVVNTPSESRAAVQKLKDAGADFVKVYSHLSRENYYAIVQEAKEHGLPFDGHVPYAIPPGEASAAGQRAIEHADTLVAAMVTQTPELDSNGRPMLAGLRGPLDPEKTQALAEVFMANGTYLVPTVVLPQHFLDAGSGEPTVLENEALRFIPRAYLDVWNANFRIRDLKEWETSAAFAREITLRLHQAGVPIVAGTDTVKPYFVPGDALHNELSTLAAAGLSEGEAIRAATLTPAQMMGVQDSGLIKEGYIADLVVLDANPLEEIANTRSITMVVKAGRVLDRVALDRLAGDIEDAAKSWSGMPSGRNR